MKWIDIRKLKELEWQLRRQGCPPYEIQERLIDVTFTDKQKKILRESFDQNSRIRLLAPDVIDKIVNPCFTGGGRKKSNRAEEQRRKDKEEWLKGKQLIAEKQQEEFGKAWENIENKFLKKAKESKAKGIDSTTMLRHLEAHNIACRKRKTSITEPTPLSWYEQNKLKSRFSPEEFQNMIGEIQACLKRILTPRQLKIYNLRKGISSKGFYPSERKKFKEIAKIVKRSESTVKTLYYYIPPKLNKDRRFLELKSKYCKELDVKL
jgi:hypothetical protein